MLTINYIMTLDIHVITVLTKKCPSFHMESLHTSTCIREIHTIFVFNCLHAKNEWNQNRTQFLFFFLNISTQPFYETPFILARLKSHNQTLHRKLHAATACFTLHPWPDLWTGLPQFLPTHYLVTQSDYATDHQYKSGHYQRMNQPPQCWDNLSQQEVWAKTLVILQNLLHVHL